MRRCFPVLWNSHLDDSKCGEYLIEKMCDDDDVVVVTRTTEHAINYDLMDRRDAASCCFRVLRLTITCLQDERPFLDLT
jgi:hypothetical protein